MALMTDTRDSLMKTKPLYQ